MLCGICLTSTSFTLSPLSAMNFETNPSSAGGLDRWVSWMIGRGEIYWVVMGGVELGWGKVGSKVKI